MTEAEMCTVQVATSDDQAPAMMTITMTPNRAAGNAAISDSATVMNADDESVMATSALQMVDCDDIMDGNDHSYRVVVTEAKPDESGTEVCYEPVAKRQRLEVAEDGDNLKALLFSINRSLSTRLDAIESKMKQLQNFCQDLDGKVNKINTTLENMGKGNGKSTSAAKSSSGMRRTKATIVGLPSNAVVETRNDDSGVSGVVSVLNKQSESLEAAALGSNVTLITLNSEDDFPHGSWLGDPNNIQYRVRCGVTPKDMLHIMETSRTADKCALKLMDYLFNREVQATSNLSGTGKHSKKQLDPLMIYGIRCHLLYQFTISEDDWHRIKLNIDSKCRTAFRRKQRGLPLKVKAFNTYGGSENDVNDDLFMEVQNDNSNTSIADESSQQMQSIHIQYKLQELPDGQVAAVPNVPVSLAGPQHVQNRVQLTEGQQIAIPESAQIQIAQMCSQDIPPGSTLVMTQVDTEGTPNEGDIVMRLTSDGTCLEQVQVQRSTVQSGDYQQQSQGAEVQAEVRTETMNANIPGDEGGTDILVEIQHEDECV